MPVAVIDLVGRGAVGGQHVRLDHLISISITCPRTRAAVPLDVPGNVASLARIWRLRKSVKCPHCGETHSVRICDAYVSTMISDGYLRWLEVQKQFDDRPAKK
jgi:hypothetical protein